MPGVAIQPGFAKSGDVILAARQRIREGEWVVRTARELPVARGIEQDHLEVGPPVERLDCAITSKAFSRGSVVLKCEVFRVAPVVEGLAHVRRRGRARKRMKRRSGLGIPRERQREERILLIGRRPRCLELLEPRE